MDSVLQGVTVQLDQHGQLIVLSGLTLIHQDPRLLMTVLLVIQATTVRETTTLNPQDPVREVTTAPVVQGPLSSIQPLLVISPRMVPLNQNLVKEARIKQPPSPPTV